MMALTATATERVRADIVKQLHLREPGCYVASFNRPNLTYRVCAKSQAVRADRSTSSAAGRRESGIVYCQSRKTAEAVAAQADRGRRQGRAVSRRAGRRRSARQNQEAVSARRGARHLRDHRVRHGHQQAERPLRHPLRPAEEHRGLLPGNRPRGPRRLAERMPAALQRRRRGEADASSSTRSPIPRNSRSPASNCSRWSTTPRARAAGGRSLLDYFGEKFRQATTAARATTASRRARPSTARWPRRSFSRASIASARRAASASA